MCPVIAHRVRLTVVFFFALFLLLTVLADTYGQPRRPPGLPTVGKSGHFSFRPPTGYAEGTVTLTPGGFSFRVAGTLSGLPGSLPGRSPGSSGLAGPPAGWMAPPGSVGTPGGYASPSGSQPVWTCGKCRGVLGYGPHDPGQSFCPHCGIRLTGPAGGPGLSAGGPPTDGSASVWSQPDTSGLELPTNPGHGGGSGGPQPSRVVPPLPPSLALAPSAAPHASVADSLSSADRTAGRIHKVLIAVGVASVVCLLVMLALVARSDGRQTSRNRRRTVRPA